MEKTLSRQQLLAIEKIRKTQQKRSGKSAKKSAQAKGVYAPKTRSNSGISKAAQQTAYFPATEPYFYGTSRPAEARGKGSAVIKLLEKFNRKNTAKKLAKPSKRGQIRPVFRFFPIENQVVNKKDSIKTQIKI